jgi:PAS domain S-box-containing protein
VAQRRQKASPKPRSRSPRQSVDTLRRIRAKTGDQRNALSPRKPANLRKQLDEANRTLREVRERFELATSVAVEGIYEWNVGAGTLFLTEPAKAFFSLWGDQLTPAAWNSRIHGDDYAGYRRAIVEHFKGRTPQLEHEYRLADGSGEYKWVLDRGKGVRDSGGRVVRLVGALSDITPRKKAELELRRARDEAKEALAHQTATGEVLKVIGRSRFDLHVVLDTVVESATRQCEADHGWLFQREGELFRWVASFGHGSEVHERIRTYFKDNEVPINRGSITGRTALEARVVQVPDVLADPEYTWSGAQRIGGYRARRTASSRRQGRRRDLPRENCAAAVHCEAD